MFLLVDDGEMLLPVQFFICYRANPLVQAERRFFSIRPREGRGAAQILGAFHESKSRMVCGRNCFDLHNIERLPAMATTQ